MSRPSLNACLVGLFGGAIWAVCKMDDFANLSAWMSITLMTKL